MIANRIRTATVALAFVLGVLLTFAALAPAKVIHEQEGSFPLNVINFLTIDNSTGPSAGDLYIGEIGSTFETRIYQADASGTPTGVELNGAETPAGSFGFINFGTFHVAGGPKVDGSTGANAGGVYVPDTANGVVDLFDEFGHYVCQVTGGAIPSASECAGSTGSETPIGGLEPLSVAVDPTNGHVAVGDASGVVYEFNEAGEYEGEFVDPHITEPGSLAFDSAGNLYIVNENPLVGPGEVVKFSSTGSFEYVLASNRTSVGVDLGNDHVYLGGAEGESSETEEFDSSGSLVSTFGIAGFGSGAHSIDVNEATSQVYVTPSFGEEGQIWSGDIVVPNVITGEVSGVGETEATLAGHVDPGTSEGGGPVESCEFEYGEDESYGQSAPCLPAPPYSSAIDISASLTGLAPSTTYHYRLAASSAEGEGHGEDRAFTTLGPASIAEETAIARTTSATVKARINPFGYETVCEVQYVDDASFQISGYVGAPTTPCTEALAAGFGDQTATATLSGLKIGTTYHFRFIATNQGGTTTGKDATFSTFAIESFSVETLDEEGQPYTQAGGHPYEMRVSLAFATTAPVGDFNPKSASANLKTVQVQLPSGLIGNPTATPACKPYEMTSFECSPASQVGRSIVFAPRGAEEDGGVYNLVPPIGVAAQLGARFNAFGTVRIDAGVRTGSDYGIHADTVFITADEAVERVEMTLWGVPADESHDFQRRCRGSATETGCSSNGPLLPFLTNPTSCSGPLTSTLSVDTWQDPGNFVSADAQMPAITGCDGPDFKPTISVQPDVLELESPTGLNVDLHVPQNQNPIGLAEANLKDTTVTLPAGLAVNPAGGAGLAGCSPAQIELHGPNPASCPDAAKVGTVEVDTPLLDHPLPGAVYVASPHDNPFGSLLAIYIAINDPQSGVVVKLAGEVKADPQTGQLSTTFKENPQVPFEDFKLDFFGGPQAALMTPQTCGQYTTTTDMTPWTSPEGEDAHPFDSFQIGSGPNGSPCANTPGEAPNGPSFSAGTVAPLAGAFTPFVLHLKREDGSQRFAAVDTELPPGLAAKLAGVPYCPNAALAAAAGKNGADEIASPSCPSASQVGSVDVGAGAGSQPLHVSGKAYLAGPYKGAPLSLAIVTPAVAGPYDLGTVVVRTALNVNPETAQVTAKSDPIPAILQGIPLDIRSVALRMDRPDFTLNPTSCEPMSVAGTALSTLGQAAPLSNRFQVGGCGDLGFKPKLSLHLFGRTRRGGDPKLKAVLTMPGSKQTNIARTTVALPHSEFLDQNHIKTVCTRVQYAAKACPEGSIYGFARAFSPLLDQPLQGPVYLRSSSHQLPDLVASLDGQIHIDLDGRIDSVNGGIRTTFEAVPDAPVSKFILTMQGGKKGLLQNSTNICVGQHLVTAKFAAHNGMLKTNHPALKPSCGKRARRHSERP
jgi:hypothetical protein